MSDYKVVLAFTGGIGKIEDYIDLDMGELTHRILATEGDIPTTKVSSSYGSIHAIEKVDGVEVLLEEFTDTLLNTNTQLGTKPNQTNILGLNNTDMTLYITDEVMEGVLLTVETNVVLKNIKVPSDTDFLVLVDNRREDLDVECAPVTRYIGDYRGDLELHVSSELATSINDFLGVNLA